MGLEQLADNLTLLRKVANDYPFGTFHFISLVINTEKWYLLDLLEPLVELNYSTFSIEPLLGRGPTDVIYSTTFGRIDMIYALVGLCNLSDYGEGYFGDEANMWTMDSNGGFTTIVEECIQNKVPFCFVKHGVDTTAIEKHHDGIQIFRYNAYWVEFYRNLVRLHQMLTCCDSITMELNKLPDGSPFSVRDGGVLIREMIVRFGEGAEMLGDSRGYYYQSILRSMGLGPEYIDIFIDCVEFCDASSEKFKKVLDELKKEFVSIEQGDKPPEDIVSFIPFVAAACPEKVDVLFRMGIGIYQNNGGGWFGFTVRGVLYWGQRYWGKHPHYDTLALALIDMGKE